MQNVACVEERIGQIERNLERAARADTGARDTVDLGGVAAGCAVPTRQVRIVFRLAASQPQAAGIGPLRIRDIECEIGTVAAIIGQRGCELERSRLGKSGQRERGGQRDGRQDRLHGSWTSFARPRERHVPAGEHRAAPARPAPRHPARSTWDPALTAS